MHAARKLALALAALALVAAVAWLRLKPPPPPEVSAEAADLVTRLAGAREIVYAVRTPGNDYHWYSNFGRTCTDQVPLWGARGRLMKLDLATKASTPLLEDLAGSVRDPQVHYDGRKILFSYRRGGEEPYHLYEIDADGRNLRQLTFGPYDDLEPTYLPDGGIVFVSSRSRRWVNCHKMPAATLFRCDGDGKNIQMLSANVEQDNSPWVLPDGRLIYTRWEYVDRSQMAFHHLWTMNPDGTNQAAFYGNQAPGGLIIDAKPVPGTNEVVAIWSPNHGWKEHAGGVAVFTNERGPDDPDALRAVSALPEDDARWFKDPFPLSADAFLVARGRELLLMDGKGRTRLLALSPEPGAEIQEPRPLVARPREPVIAARTNLSRTTGTLVIQDVGHGRRGEEIRPGEIARVAVLETLPKPVNFSGTPAPTSLSGTFTLTRVLGTAPVEPDGSAYLEVPANRPLTLLALDAEGRSVQRQLSFLSVMPGESVSCAGCHEHRATAPPDYARGPALLAVQRPPSPLAPVEGVPPVIDYPRDIQPLWDRHCVSCHDSEKRAGGVDLTGDRGPVFSLSYYALSVRRQFFLGGNLEKGNYPPRTLGDSISPLMWKLDGGVDDVRLVEAFDPRPEVFPKLQKRPSSHRDVRLSKPEIDRVRWWINTGAVYAGTYAALGESGTLGWADFNDIRDNLADLPAVRRGSQRIAARCGTCHSGERRLPLSAADQTAPYAHDGDVGWDSGLWDSDYDDPRVSRLSRHLLFNLTHPERSALLLAPLAKEAGGYGTCRTLDGQAVFRDAKDPDYAALLASIQESARRLDEIKRFDMAGFRPNPAWIREMTRFGVLEPGASGPTDVYAAEERYWQSLWHRPGAKEPWGPESAAGGAR